MFVHVSRQGSDNIPDPLADQGEANVVETTVSGQQVTVGVAASSQGKSPASSQVVAARKAQGATRNKGRQAIVSQSDSDGADSDEQQTPHIAKRKQRRLQKEQPKIGEFVCICVRGINSTFTIGRGPRVVIPVDGPWIQNIVDELLPRAGEPRSSGRSASCQEDPRSALTGMDAGRIMWRPLTVSTTPSWTLVFTNADGEKRETRSGLAVPLK